MLRPAVYTVWKKSAMGFSGTDGFSVYDSSGRLTFRVDNYSRKGVSKCLAISGNGQEALLLMDGGGKPLLSLKPQILSVHKRWNGYLGECGTTADQNILLFSVKRSSFFHCNELEVFAGNQINQSTEPCYRINCNFAKRHCKIICGTGGTAAEITQKRVNGTIGLSNDVFSLVVHPGFDGKLMMAFVVIIDRMGPFISWKSM